MPAPCVRVFGGSGLRRSSCTALALPERKEQDSDSACGHDGWQRFRRTAHERRSSARVLRMAQSMAFAEFGSTRISLRDPVTALHGRGARSCAGSWPRR